MGVSSVFTASDVTLLKICGRLARDGNIIINSYKSYWLRDIVSQVELVAKTIVCLVENKLLTRVSVSTSVSSK